MFGLDLILLEGSVDTVSDPDVAVAEDSTDQFDLGSVPDGMGGEVVTEAVRG